MECRKTSQIEQTDPLLSKNVFTESNDSTWISEGLLGILKFCSSTHQINCSLNLIFWSSSTEAFPFPDLQANCPQHHHIRRRKTHFNQKESGFQAQLQRYNTGYLSSSELWLTCYFNPLCMRKARDLGVLCLVSDALWKPCEKLCLADRTTSQQHSSCNKTYSWRPLWWAVF